MKKKIVSILSLLMIVCLIVTGLFGCGSKWNGENVTLKDVDTEVVIKGGFIGQTKNYLYFINGIGTSSEDNTLGTPKKGALYAVDKNDLTKTSVIVPKLFVAGDYKSGLFIYDGYVYYGSPNTGKNPQGEIANTELTFARTKLDGTGTETFFTIGSLSSEYRIVKGADNSVYIVYYNSTEKAIISYNTSTKKAITVAKTDVKADESLNVYTFMNSEYIDDAVVLYSTNIYAEDYNEESASEEGYERKTKSFNYIYAYKVGDEKVNDNFYGVKVLDGNKTVTETYTITKNFKDSVIYSVAKSDGAGITEYYAIKISDLYAKKNEEAKKLFNVDFFSLEGSSIIEDVENVYYVDSENGFIIKSTLIANDKTELAEKTNPVAKSSTVGTLYFAYGDYIYYSNSDGKLARIKIANVDESEKADVNEQRVSEDTVSTSWYNPQIISYGEGTDKKNYIFYADTSINGLSYVKYISIDGEVKEKDTDDDDKIDLWYLSGAEFVGEMTDADKAKAVENQINAISESFDKSGRIVFDTDEEGEIKLVDGKPTFEVLAKARAKYDSYKDNKAVYEAVSSESVALLEKYEKAFNLSVLTYPLDGFNKLSDADKQNKKSVYEAVKAELEKIFNEDTSEDHKTYGEIRDLVVKNLNYEYGKAKNFFEPSEE